jgi:DNA-binding PadR family transcriptional regulator
MTPTHAEFHVLLSLMNGPRHGYGIMQDVAALSDGRVTIGPGTLYSMLKRLLRDDIIEEVEPDTERRRCYRLTRTGRRVAGEEAERLSALVQFHRQKRRPA